MLELRHEGDEIVLRGAEYELAVKAADPKQARLRMRGAPAAELQALSGCDADGQTDVVWPAGAAQPVEADGALSIVVPARSSLWGPAEYIFRGTTETLELYAKRRGRRAIDTLHFGAGRDYHGRESLSSPHWRSLFNPEPNARRKHYFGQAEHAIIGVSSDPQYYRGNWLFSPGPLCYAADLSCCWLAAGIAARPGQLNFDRFEYAGTAAGFGMQLRYDGHVTSEAEWESPHLVLMGADDEFAAVGRYAQWLRENGLAPAGRREQHDWWREPIFCGWGEQVALEGRTSAIVLPAVPAADHCTQANYERFLEVLEANGVAPGTIVLDDKWQRSYGENEVDTSKWPNARAFVDRQHSLGRHVLLWLRAWHPEGLPAEECLLDASGEALAVDAGSPAYVSRLRGQVRRLLVDLGADGFKIDFTHRLPVQRRTRSVSGLWGIELLHRLMATIYDAAKEAKQDALVMAHTANPYFADVVDVLRLNDVANVVAQPSYLESMVVRARVAELASPHWIIDTDNWPSPNRAAWLEYCREQPRLGVPSLYYATRVYYLSEDDVVTEEALRAEDYAEVAGLWEAYRKRRRHRDA